MKNYMLLSFVFIGLIFVFGCSSGKSTARSDYNFSNVYKIAVIDVFGPLGNEGAKNQVADMVAMQLLQKGYAPVERAQVVNILNEQKFQHDGNSTPEQDAVKAGKIMNVPTVVIVNVSKFTEDISMSIKMIDVEDGSVLWIGNGTGTQGKLLGTILGAAAGAGAGILVGGDETSGQVAGGVIGGVIGGAAGHLLTPQQAKAAEDVITKICKDMPSRIQVQHKKGWFAK